MEAQEKGPAHCPHARRLEVALELSDVPPDPLQFFCSLGKTDAFCLFVM